MTLLCFYCFEVFDEGLLQHHWEYDCLQILDEDHEKLQRLSNDKHIR